MEDYADAVKHNDKVLVTAHDALGKFLLGAPFPATTHGSQSRLRGGVKRQVHYVELEDGSGPTLVIEVYTK